MKRQITQDLANADLPSQIAAVVSRALFADALLLSGMSGSDEVFEETKSKRGLTGDFLVNEIQKGFRSAMLSAPELLGSEDSTEEVKN